MCDNTADGVHAFEKMKLYNSLPPVTVACMVSPLTQRFLKVLSSCAMVHLCVYYKSSDFVAKETVGVGVHDCAKTVIICIGILE